MMTLFDAPDRESSCVRRSRTDTPLQSLGLFNETMRVEMARCWANELLKNYETDEERIDALIEKVACRKPLPEEKEVCRMLLAEAQREFSQSPERAAQLLNIGDAAVAAKLSKTEVAAWTQVCSAVLASDLAIVLY